MWATVGHKVQMFVIKCTFRRGFGAGEVLKFINKNFSPKTVVSPDHNCFAAAYPSNIKVVYFKTLSQPWAPYETYWIIVRMSALTTVSAIFNAHANSLAMPCIDWALSNKMNNDGFNYLGHLVTPILLLMDH